MGGIVMTFSVWHLLLIVPAVLAWFAQSRVRGIYERHADTPQHANLTGIEVARRLLQRHGLMDVTIERTAGYLSDSYDPQTRTLRISDGVANTSSVTSLGIVAHEVAHAIQHAEDYRFMRLRTAAAERLNGVAQWGSLAMIAGILLQIPVLWAFSGLVLLASLVFAVITLPVERDASRRALATLEETGLATGQEIEGARRVLRAAAFTYMAGLAQRLGTFLFFALAALALFGIFTR
jgi:uncharacterized protein